MLPIQVRVDLGIMAMKEKFAFTKAPWLQRHHHLQFCGIPGTLFGGGRNLTPLQSYSQRIQPTKQLHFLSIIIILLFVLLFNGISTDLGYLMT